MSSAIFASLKKLKSQSFEYDTKSVLLICSLTENEPKMVFCELQQT